MYIPVFPRVIVALFDPFETLRLIVDPWYIEWFEILVIATPKLSTEHRVTHYTEDKPEGHAYQKYVSNRWDGIDQSVDYNLLYEKNDCIQWNLALSRTSANSIKELMYFST